jgi:hypothetical protein
MPDVIMIAKIDEYGDVWWNIGRGLMFHGPGQIDLRPVDGWKFLDMAHRALPTRCGPIVCFASGKGVR